MSGRVLVEGAPATTPARQVRADEPLRLLGRPARFVSRGGEKLAGALTAFRVEVVGRRALDVGASTGGFTDCLLQAGAAHVHAVDVGRGQLAWALRTHPNVTVLEGTNIRDLHASHLGGPVDLVVADVAFISLVQVVPALVRCGVEGGSFVLLVKPQFEAGRARVGRGGIVRDPGVHRAVLAEVVAGIGGGGLIVTDVVPSPLRGVSGNIEFFALCTAHGETVAPERLDAVVDHAHAREEE